MYTVLLALILAGTPDVQAGCTGSKAASSCVGSSCTGKVKYTRVRLAVVAGCTGSKVTASCTGSKAAASCVGSSCTGSKVAASCTGSKAPRVRYVRAKLVSSCAGSSCAGAGVATPAKSAAPVKGTPPPLPPIDSKPTKKADYLPPIQSEILVVSPRSFRRLINQ